MAGGAVKSNPTKTRKRVEVSQETTAPSLVRAKDGSAFARCEECDKDVPVALISFHSCSLDARIKMNLEGQVVEKPIETNKPTEEKKPSSTEPKLKKAKVEKKGKKGKDPNKPKRPPTAFFLFMDDFRKEFKEANPNSKDINFFFIFYFIFYVHCKEPWNLQFHFKMEFRLQRRVVRSGRLWLIRRRSFIKTKLQSLKLSIRSWRRIVLKMKRKKQVLTKKTQRRKYKKWSSCKFCDLVVSQDVKIVDHRGFPIVV